MELLDTAYDTANHQPHTDRIFLLKNFRQLRSQLFGISIFLLQKKGKQNPSTVIQKCDAKMPRIKHIHTEVLNIPHTKYPAFFVLLRYTIRHHHPRLHFLMWVSLPFRKQLQYPAAIRLPVKNFFHHFIEPVLLTHTFRTARCDSVPSFLQKCQLRPDASLQLLFIDRLQ